MSNLSILPEEVRHEFEVKEDGKVVCKSWRALARVCDISESVFTDYREGRLMHNILTAKNVPSCLQSLTGKDFRLTAEIDEVAMSCFILYFAYESLSPRTQAKKVALAMTAIGLRAVLQQELGWQPSSQSSFKLPTNYREALEMLLDVEKTHEKVTANYPGLSGVYDSCGRDLLPVPELPANFKLAQWLSWKHIYLNLSDAISFGNFTASTVERDTGKRLSRQGRKIIYNQQHLPLLDECYKSWLQNRKAV